MTSEQFSELWKMLEEFDFEELVNIPTGWKCGKCEKVLKNACLVACECLYCRNCFEKMRAEGLTFCIGSKVKCKSSVLSNCVERFKKDEKISKLVVKCPQQDCSTKCELIKMVDHLKLCPKLGVKCWFHGLGCLQDKIEREKIQDHFVAEQERHSKILFDMIGSLRNKIKENSEKMKKSEDEIPMLKENLTWKDEELLSIKDEIESIKSEKGHLKEEFERQYSQSETIPVTTSGSLVDGVIQRCSQTGNGTPSRSSFAASNVGDNLESVDQSFANVKFEWQIHRIEEQNDYDFIFSPFFGDLSNTYQMRLIFQKVGKLFQVSLLVEEAYNVVMDPKIRMKGTVQIKNKAQSTVGRSVTKIRPLKEYMSVNLSENLFEFNMDDLDEQGLLQENGCIIQFFANYLR